MRYSNHWLNWQRVLKGKSKIPLIMRRHPHHRPIPIRHQHIVTHPNRHRLPSQRMLHKQPGRHPQLVLNRQLSLSSPPRLALFNKRRQRSITSSRIHSQRMLRRHRTKRHPHDGVCTGREHIHTTILDQGARRITNIVCESKPHTFTLANPVLLHQAHFVWPTCQRGLVVTNLHMVKQLLCVMRDVEVVTRNLALFYQSAGAPTAAIDHLLVG